MIEKLSSGCNKSCKETKQQTIDKLDLIKNAVEQEEEEGKKVSKKEQEEGEEILKEISNFFLEFDKKTYNWETHKKRLVKEISKAFEKGYLNEDHYNLMKNQVEKSSTFNPAILTSLHEMKEQTEQELATRRRQSQKEKSAWEQSKVELKAWKTGVQSMSKTEALSKSSSAAGALWGAIGKFRATKDDGSPDELKIVSGVSDIANAIAEFLPPPASVVTGSVSRILNIFGAGGPSTEKVVKEEFRKMKQFTTNLFTKQNKLIKSQTQEILSAINDTQKFWINDKITKLLVASEGLHKTLDEHLIFLDTYRYKQINDDTANTLTNLVDITKDTDRFVRIKRNFENVCLDSKQRLMQSNYTVNENELCTSILYNFLAINMKRETVMHAFISKLRQSNKHRESVEGFLNIATVRKNEMKLWTRNKIMKNDSLVCPLFITEIGNWKNSIYMQSTRNFILNIDRNLSDRLNGLTTEYCQDVVDNNVKKHCQCYEEGSISIHCNIDSKKCHCNEKFRGEKCDIRSSKYIVLQSIDRTRIELDYFY